MVAPVFHNIVQGQTLAFEVRLIGEDLAGATAFIRTGAGIPEVDFTISTVLPDTVSVRAESTVLFAPGVHPFRLWVEFSDGTDDVVVTGLIEVETALNFWADGMGIIDGGTPSTDHEAVVDGGPV